MATLESRLAIWLTNLLHRPSVFSLKFRVLTDATFFGYLWTALSETGGEHTHSLSLSLTYTQTHTHSLALSLTHTHTLTHTDTHAHKHTDTPERTIADIATRWSFHCYLSQKSFRFGFETFHSRFLSGWADFLLFWISEGYVTNFAPHRTLKFIA